MTYSPVIFFFINHYESHHLAQIDQQIHERIILSISPEYLKSVSSPATNLNQCFFCQNKTNHKLSLNFQNQKRFLYFIHKINSTEGFGADLIEQSAFIELMIFLNRLFYVNQDQLIEEDGSVYHKQVDNILSYINQNITNTLSLRELAEYFYLSESYLCRIFKKTTGTTINKYITAKRITKAKSLLAQGSTVSEACDLSGFRDYSNFLKSFTQAVGISPKKYAGFVTR